MIFRKQSIYELECKSLRLLLKLFKIKPGYPKRQKSKVITL